MNGLRKSALLCALMMTANSFATEQAAVAQAAVAAVQASGMRLRNKIGLYLAAAGTVGGVIYHIKKVNDRANALKRIEKNACITQKKKQQLLSQVTGQQTRARIYNVGIHGDFGRISDIVTQQDKFINELLDSLGNNVVIKYLVDPVSREFDIDESNYLPGAGRENLLEHYGLISIQAEKKFLLGDNGMGRVERLVPGSRKRMTELFCDVCKDMRVDPLTVFEKPTAQIEQALDKRMADKFKELDTPASDNWAYTYLKGYYPNCMAKALKLNWDLFKRVKRLDTMNKIVLARLRGGDRNPVRTSLETLKQRLETVCNEDMPNWRCQNLPNQDLTHEQGEHNVPKNQNELVDSHQIIALQGILNSLNLQVDRTSAALESENDTWDRIQLKRVLCMKVLKAMSSKLNDLTAELDTAQGPHTVGRCNALMVDAHDFCTESWFALKGLVAESSF